MIDSDSDSEKLTQETNIKLINNNIVDINNIINDL